MTCWGVLGAGRNPYFKMSDGASFLAARIASKTPICSNTDCILQQTVVDKYRPTRLRKMLLKSLTTCAKSVLEACALVVRFSSSSDIFLLSSDSSFFLGALMCLVTDRFRKGRYPRIFAFRRVSISRWVYS